MINQNIYHNSQYIAKIFLWLDTRGVVATYMRSRDKDAIRFRIST